MWDNEQHTWSLYICGCKCLSPALPLTLKLIFSLSLGFLLLSKCLSSSKGLIVECICNSYLRFFYVIISQDRWSVLLGWKTEMFHVGKETVIVLWHHARYRHGNKWIINLFLYECGLIQQFLREFSILSTKSQKQYFQIMKMIPINLVFGIYLFVFCREPGDRRGREFPSVKTGKIKMRFFHLFCCKSV